MRTALLCFLLLVFPASAEAAIVQLEVRPGIAATAEYLPGRRDKPAVLLLHGFLQTRDFPTVATLAHGLSDAGYPVLAPTLSLDIPNRMQSLSCGAIHRHSLDDDVAEISRWVEWLKSHGHRAIVLVGHSFGSMQLLAYLNSGPDPAVKAYVATSLIEAQIGGTSRSALVAQLQNRIESGQHALITQHLAICRKYLSTPESLLSYVRWDQVRTLAALKASPVRVELIMGDSDEMLGRSWIRALKHVQAPMVVVKGANHFMDGAHEFDLLQYTLDFLKRVRQAPRG